MEMAVINSKGIKAEHLAPLLMGFLFFLYIFGIKPLNVNDITWIGGVDAMQNYLGWQFFRQAPWSFPIIGSSPYFGMELGSSVVYSDSNPLLAIFFKILSPILPDNFQYFGVWLALCCILQSVVAWKIVSLFTQNRAVKFLATLIIMFNPAWINRVGHINLIAHFLILSAIYLVLSSNEKGKKLKWGLLILISFSVHFYLALMVSVIWGSNVLSRYFTKKESFKSLFIEFIVIISLSVGLLYILGYFTVSDVSKSGQYGTFGANLLSPVMPSGWSYILSELSIPQSRFESFNFWGVGAIIMVLLSIVIFILKPSKIKMNEKSITLLISSVFFSLLYTTNVISIGSLTYEIKLPYQLLDALSVVRASGRFFWPVTYVIIISSIVCLVSKLKGKSLYATLLLICIIQITDMSKGYNKSSFYFYKPQIKESNLKNYFWTNDVKHYSAIRYVPFQSHISPWYEISKVAQESNISTDAVYLARFSGRIANELNESVISDLALGRYKDDEIYVIRDDLVDYVSLRQGDIIYKIDNLNVLAPGLKSCADCKVVRQTTSNGIYLFKSNWLGQQSMGAWNDGKKTLMLVRSNSKEVYLNISYNAFTPSQVKRQRLRFSVDGKELKEFVVDRNGSLTLNWPNTKGKGISVLTIDTPDAVEPRKIGLNTDGRLISIAITSMQLN